MVMKFYSFFQTDNVLFHTNFIIYIFKIPIFSQERRKVCQFIDTRAIYDWLQACSCSLPYWISFLSETAASSALAGRYEKFRQIGSASALKPGSCRPACTRGCRRWRWCRCWRRRGRPHLF